MKNNFIIVWKSSRDQLDISYKNKKIKDPFKKSI